MDTSTCGEQRKMRNITIKCVACSKRLMKRQKEVVVKFRINRINHTTIEIICLLFLVFLLFSYQKYLILTQKSLSLTQGHGERLVSHTRRIADQYLLSCVCVCVCVCVFVCVCVCVCSCVAHMRSEMRVLPAVPGLGFSIFSTTTCRRHFHVTAQAATPLELKHDTPLTNLAACQQDTVRISARELRPPELTHATPLTNLAAYLHTLTDLQGRGAARHFRHM